MGAVGECVYAGGVGAAVEVGANYSVAVCGGNEAVGEGVHRIVNAGNSVAWDKGKGSNGAQGSQGDCVDRDGKSGKDRENEEDRDEHGLFSSCAEW